MISTILSSDNVNDEEDPLLGMEVDGDDNDPFSWKFIFDKERQSCNKKLGKLLASNTPLSHDIIIEIMEYIGFESQLIELNPVCYYEFYSIFDLLLIITILLFHCTVIILMNFTIPTIIFALIETIIIIFFYLYFNGEIKHSHWSICDQYHSFYDCIHMSLELFVNIPFMVYLTFFTHELSAKKYLYFMFFVFYALNITYQHIMYHFCDNLSNINNNLSPMFVCVLYGPLFVYIFGIIDRSIFCILLGAFLFYISIILVNLSHWIHSISQENCLFNDRISMLTYLFLIIHDLMIGYFAFSIYFNDDYAVYSVQWIVSVFLIVFVTIEAVIVFVFYVLLNFIFCIFHSNQRDLSNRVSKFNSFYSYLHMTLDWCTRIPIAILLIYYIYSSDDDGSNDSICYAAVSVYMLYDIYKFTLLFYYMDTESIESMTDSKKSIAQIIMFFTKIPLILFVFGVVYMATKWLQPNNNEDSKNNVVNMIFVVFGGIYFTCMLPTFLNVLRCCRG